LTSNTFRVKSISFLVCVIEVQRRWARHSSLLNVEVMMFGSWHDVGWMIMLVFEGFLYIHVEILPLGSLDKWTSRKAMVPSTSSFV
jgi:hypothetical protein